MGKKLTEKQKAKRKVREGLARVRAAGEDARRRRASTAERIAPPDGQPLPPNYPSSQPRRLAEEQDDGWLRRWDEAADADDKKDMVAAADRKPFAKAAAIPQQQQPPKKKIARIADPDGSPKTRGPATAGAKAFFDKLKELIDTYYRDALDAARTAEYGWLEEGLLDENSKTDRRIQKGVYREMVLAFPDAKHYLEKTYSQQRRRTLKWKEKVLQRLPPRRKKPVETLFKIFDFIEKHTVPYNDNYRYDSPHPTDAQRKAGQRDFVLFVPDYPLMSAELGLSEWQLRRYLKWLTGREDGLKKLGGGRGSRKITVYGVGDWYWATPEAGKKSITKRNFVWKNATVKKWPLGDINIQTGQSSTGGAR